ncbi:MAG: nickel pincer cofactor biosynthesis protein LarC [Nitrospira sp.]|nr:nickel pincer cofactor biosynthesis protein LarC [Nitrospira sp.]
MHLHFDCFSGISGDMILGALVDAGLSPHRLRKGLGSLPISGYRLKVSKVHRGALHATKVNVIAREQTPPRSWPQIQRVLAAGRLPPWVTYHAQAVFERIARAEGTVHGQDPARVHFHQLGMVDSLIDVVGGLLGCHELGAQTFSATPVNVGAGIIESAHGTLPVPAPAVAELAKGCPVYSHGPALELTTPTGMALLTTLTTTFGQLPPVVPDAIGYGAGTANPPDWPNVLRVFLSSSETTTSPEADLVVQLDTNIDDMNPQRYEAVMERLFQNGALDVSMTPTMMKHHRPGVILTVLGHPEHAGALTQTLFRETTTLGVRSQLVSRTTLARSMRTVRLPQGRVRVKVVHVGDTVQYRPEFQDCQAIANTTGLPVQEIIDTVMRKFS